MANPHFGTDLFTIDTGVVNSQTIAQWTADWWTWALNLETNDNPFTQPDGTHVTAHNATNDGSMFFIAGVQQTGPINVSSGTPLLVPLINFVDTAPEALPNPHANANAIHSTENANLHSFDGGLSNLFASITPMNGEAIPIPIVSQDIVDTSFFDPGTANAGTLATDFFGVAPANTSMAPARAGGAWLVIDFLKPGTYALAFGGHSNGTASGVKPFDINITDSIHVT